MGREGYTCIFISKTTHCAPCLLLFGSCLCMSKHLPTNSVDLVSTTPLSECELASAVCQPLPVMSDASQPPPTVMLTLFLCLKKT